MSIRFHDWWLGPEVQAKASEIAPYPSHANWYENFPWTRLANVSMPADEKPIVDYATLRQSGPARVRELLQDGSFGGVYQQSDEDMRALWGVGVEETRKQLEQPWANQY
jgi:creatinine amidohydrolase